MIRTSLRWILGRVKPTMTDTARRILLHAVLGLSATSASAASQAAPPVPLNHVYIVLDTATFADVAGSAFLRDEFAAVRQEARSTGEGRSWGGVYVHGEHTYVEFFRAAAAAQRQPGFSGIGFGVERTGDLRHVASRLAAATGRPLYRDPVTMREGNDTIPWFEQAAVMYPGYPGTIAQLYTWVMEVRPEFMRRVIYRDLPTYEIGVTRREYLARRFAPDRHLKDVVAATVALDSLRGARFVTELRALGYSVRMRADTAHAYGPGIQFTVVPSTADRFGIVELRFSLLRPKRGQLRHTFGDRSVLSFHGRTATWTFNDARDASVPPPLPPAAAALRGHLSDGELRNLRHIQRIHEPGLGLVRRFRESGLLADSAEWWVAGPREVLPFAGSWRGFEGVVEFEKRLSATMRYDKVELREYLVSGNEVVAIFLGEGVARATGRPFRGEIVRVYTFAGDKVVRVRNYYDTDAYVRAVRGEP